LRGSGINAALQPIGLLQIKTLLNLFKKVLFSAPFGSFLNPISLPCNSFRLNTYRKFFCLKILCFNHWHEDEME
jgi:hypothetical protein